MNSDAARPIADNICILYDQTGAIVHTHRIVTFPGGRLVPDDELVTRTHQQASAAGRDAAGLSALTVPGDQFDRTAHYRVDVVGKTLVKIKP